MCHDVRTDEDLRMVPANKYGPVERIHESNLEYDTDRDNDVESDGEIYPLNVNEIRRAYKPGNKLTNRTLRILHDFEDHLSSFVGGTLKSAKFYADYVAVILNFVGGDIKHITKDSIFF